ncbi:MAG: hypothetical protein NVS2B14_03770 [Chamaesiphon sp.]
MSRSRPDYSSFIERLNILNNENDPMAILARSGGEQQTDTLAVFPCPEVDEQGQYHLYFFSHGLRHLPSSAIEGINEFEPGDVWVERVNKSPTPLQFRLLCKMSVEAPDDFRPFSSPQYQPLIAKIATAAMSS